MSTLHYPVVDVLQPELNRQAPGSWSRPFELRHFAPGLEPGMSPNDTSHALFRGPGIAVRLNG